MLDKPHKCICVDGMQTLASKMGDAVASVGGGTGYFIVLIRECPITNGFSVAAVSDIENAQLKSILDDLLKPENEAGSIINKS